MRSIAEAFPNRICGVLRTENAEAGFQACLAAREAGVSTIEITKTVPSCFELIKGLIATTGGKYPIGVGTVWDPGAVTEAKQAGASFVVTAVLLPEVAEACRKEDILCVLGALTPSTIPFPCIRAGEAAWPSCDRSLLRAQRLVPWVVV